jgi:hypothetical protein
MVLYTCLTLTAQFLHYPAKVPIPEAELAAAAAAADAASKPTKLALGTEGGFAIEPQKDYTLDKTAELVVLQGAGQQRLRVALPCADLPQLVINIINAIQVGGSSYRVGLVNGHLHAVLAD